jgi:hypothetical protein
VQISAVVKVLRGVRPRLRISREDVVLDDSGIFVVVRGLPYTRR